MNTLPVEKQKEKIIRITDDSATVEIYPFQATFRHDGIKINPIPVYKIDFSKTQGSCFIPNETRNEMVKIAASALGKEIQRYRWLIEPLDAFTNESIITHLRELGKGAEGMLRIQGIGGPVWEADYDFVKKLRMSLNQHPFHFNIYSLRIGAQKAYLWPFLAKNPSRKTTAAKNRLAEIQKKRARA